MYEILYCDIMCHMSSCALEYHTFSRNEIVVMITRMEFWLNQTLNKSHRSIISTQNSSRSNICAKQPYSLISKVAYNGLIQLCFGPDTHHTSTQNKGQVHVNINMSDANKPSNDSPCELVQTQ